LREDTQALLTAFAAVREFVGSFAQRKRIMNEKSFVSMERRICLACGHRYDTNTLLFDRRLAKSLSQYTITGWGLCPNDQKRYEDGFVALVECDPAKSGVGPTTQNLLPNSAYRTGVVVHLKRAVFERICNVTISPDLPLVFVEPGVIAKIRALGDEEAPTA
jgi:hypothetical protein